MMIFNNAEIYKISNVFVKSDILYIVVTCDALKTCLSMYVNTCVHACVCVCVTLVPCSSSSLSSVESTLARCDVMGLLAVTPSALLSNIEGGKNAGRTRKNQEHGEHGHRRGGGGEIPYLGNGAMTRVTPDAAVCKEESQCFWRAIWAGVGGLHASNKNLRRFEFVGVFLAIARNFPACSKS